MLARFLYPKSIVNLSSSKNSMKIILIVNPVAGRGRSLRSLPKIREYLNELRLENEILISAGPMDAKLLAHNAAKDGADIVIAVGGDGTVNEVLNGLIGTESALGVIPVGCGNDFARLLNISREVRDACEQIAKGRFGRIDLGRLRIGDSFFRYFAAATGVGFDSAVSQRSASLKHQLHWLPWKPFDFPVYLLSAIFSFSSYHAIKLRIAGDSLSIDSDCYVASITNGKSLIGKFKINPQAEIDDGYFDLCLFSSMDFGELVFLIPRVLTGRHLNHAKVIMLRSKKFTITPTCAIRPHVDGEVIDVAADQIEIENIHLGLRVWQNWIGAPK